MPHVFHSPAYKRFLELLIAARRDAGLNQTELGKLLGRRQTFVSKIETGERRIDLVEFLIIAEALDCNPHEILTEVQQSINATTI